MCVDYGVELSRHVTNRFVPRRGNELAALLVTNERRANPVFVVYEGMAESALDSEKLPIESVNIAIPGHNAHQFAAARAKRHLASV